MEKIKKFLINNKFNIILLSIYLIITIFTMFHHEIWRDEAQVWCLVRDLNIIDVFKATRIEGHPILWYLLVMPFAKMGLPVISMQILSLILVFSAVVFFLFKAPFNNLFKTLFIFGAGMLYYMPIISRNYALIPIIIFLIAYFYKNRTQKPLLYTVLLILITQTHSLMFGFAAVLFLLFYVENRDTWLKNKNLSSFAPVILFLLNFLFLSFIFFNAALKNVSVLIYIYRQEQIWQTLSLFSSDHIIFTPNFTCVHILFYIALFFIGYAFYKQDKKIFFIFTSSFLYLITIFYKIWYHGITYQKSFLFLLILVFCLWILKEENKMFIYEKINNDFSLQNIAKLIFRPVIYILLVTSLLISVNAVYKDIFYAFSGAKQIATFIQKNLKDESTFIYLGYDFMIPTLSAYLPDKKIYLYGKGAVTYHDFSDKIYESKPIPITPYIIVHNNWENEILLKTLKKIIISSEKEYSDETFTLYELNEPTKIYLENNVNEFK